MVQRMETGMFCNRLAGALAAILAVCLSTVAATAQAPQSLPQAVLVIDSSRSMWGHIDQINKVVHLRQALGKIFTDYEDRIALGLFAYGHQKDQGCDDFGEIEPLSAIDAAGHAGAVNAIAPKGSTPIAAALEAAGLKLADAPGERHIILLSDGADNCKGDPCAMAEKLSRRGQRLSIHTITFEKDANEELTALACVSAPSDGVFVHASNRAELDKALEEVFARVVAPPSAPAIKPGGLLSDISPGDPVPVRMTAYLGGGSNEIRDGLVWRVFAGRAGEDGRYQLLHESSEARPQWDLHPGYYFVHLSYGLAHATKRIDVIDAQPMHEQISLNAGGLRLRAAQIEGTPLSSGDVSFEILSEETDQFGNRMRLVADAPSGPVIRLNSGVYGVVSRYGKSNAVVESKVEIKPGQLAEAILIHNAAKVTFRLVERPGGEAIADTKWTIRSEAGAVVRESAGAFPTHVLAAGKYRVEAEQNGRSYQREFEVTGGGLEEVEVLMR